MRTLPVLSVLLFLTANLCNGQMTISKVSYTCTTNLAKGKVHDGLNTLYFDQEKGLFVHNDFPKENEYVQKEALVHFTKGDPEGLPVYINLKERQLYYKSEYGSPPNEVFIFKEDLPEINWKIGTETKTVESFHCINAAGMFGGRVYDVWFTPEIPVSLGPYKLWGLPGLILEAKSRDGKVFYELNGYEPHVKTEVRIEKPKLGTEISWEDFKTFTINRLLMVETLSGTNNDPPPDWEIERNKFTIISEYKSQRAARQKKQ